MLSYAILSTRVARSHIALFSRCCTYLLVIGFTLLSQGRVAHHKTTLGIISSLIILPYTYELYCSSFACLKVSFRFSSSSGLSLDWGHACIRCSQKAIDMFTFRVQTCHVVTSHRTRQWIDEPRSCHQCCVPAQLCHVQHKLSARTSEAFHTPTEAALELRDAVKTGNAFR